MKDIRLEDVDTRLCEEARAIRQQDGYSRLVHERCMTALRREGLTGSGLTPQRGRIGWREAVGFGVAAAVALGAWLMLRTPEPPESPPPQIVIPKVPEVPGREDPQMDTPIALPATTVLDERKFAYLDRDAKRLLVFVAGQFPEFPSQPTRRLPE